MGVKVEKSSFDEIVAVYNDKGTGAAYSYITETFGATAPGSVMNRIRKCGDYIFDRESHRLERKKAPAESELFMSIDDLCSRHQKTPAQCDTGMRTEALERLTRELISDRLLEISRYVIVDNVTRTIMIDRTTLAADGYKLNII